jgi:formaldehyde-activating enzyme involved in methanogenesis
MCFIHFSVQNFNEIYNYYESIKINISHAIKSIKIGKQKEICKKTQSIGGGGCPLVFVFEIKYASIFHLIQISI